MLADEEVIMKNKSYIVIGLSMFGRQVVRSLSLTEIELLVIDKNAKKLEEFAGMVLNTICADAANPDVLNQLDIASFDGAVVDTDDNLESKVLITLQLKELGVPNIIVKATSEIEGRLLRRVGADKVIQPNREVGIRVANQIAGRKYFEAIELPQNYSINDFVVPADWADKSIRELNLRTNHGITVLGVHRNGGLIANPSPDIILQSGDIMVILGEVEQLNQLRDKFS